MTRALDPTEFRLKIETFELAISTLWDRPMDPEIRSAFAAVLSSWNVLADAAFGPMQRTRTCPSCRRSNVQAGPRCVFCWHRLAAFDASAEA